MISRRAERRLGTTFHPGEIADLRHARLTARRGVNDSEDRDVRRGIADTPEGRPHRSARALHTYTQGDG